MKNANFINCQIIGIPKQHNRIDQRNTKFQLSLLTFLFVILFNISNAQQKLGKLNELGIGIDIGGKELYNAAIVSYRVEFNKLLSTSIRYSTNFKNLHRIGGGIEFHPWNSVRIIPSIGLEIFYNRDIFKAQGFDEPSKYSSTHIPISINILLSSKLKFSLGVVPVYASINDGIFIRSNLNYKLPY